ncbi:MAG: 1-deoxy-D-xylulose-5-phosphate reductoisomerase [Bacteroidota bacterium]|nr:1-deoxy-D-xylulose-5-phosphate reductoisomerase [Bacteroidota bacterium]
MIKKIAILGSTGSIGTQALEIVKHNPESFQVEVLTANANADLLIKQSIEFKPNAVVIGKESLFAVVRDALEKYDIKVFAGSDAISQIVEMENINLVLVAIVGFSGLKPTINAINAGKDIAIANKETFVVAGDIVTQLAKQKGVNILPVDSEHSAIFQSLAGECHNPIEKIYLTASGGPFYGKSLNELKNVTKRQALSHPNWEMGNKITIDSASMMNKGLEVIEAKWLFDLAPEQIDIVIHKQSVIHSMVQFEDGSMKAQMGLPDMKVPIQYAMTYPVRMKNSFKRFDFMDYPQFTFEKPDREVFTSIQLAYDAINKGGNIPCVLNAANEVAVDAFLHEKLGFVQMAEIVEKCISLVDYIKKPTFDDYLITDLETRKLALSLIK